MISSSSAFHLACANESNAHEADTSQAVWLGEAILTCEDDCKQLDRHSIPSTHLRRTI